MQPGLAPTSWINCLKHSTADLTFQGLLTQILVFFTKAGVTYHPPHSTAGVPPFPCFPDNTAGLTAPASQQKDPIFLYTAQQAALLSRPHSTAGPTLSPLTSQHSKSPGSPHTAQSASQSSWGGGASLPAPSVSSGSGVPPRTPALPRRILSLGAGPFTAFALALQARRNLEEQLLGAAKLYGIPRATDGPLKQC